jgi:hypothetical protein
MRGADEDTADEEGEVGGGELEGGVETDLGWVEEGAAG